MKCTIAAIQAIESVDRINGCPNGQAKSADKI